MNVALTLSALSDGISRLVIRAAAGAQLDPLQQMRALPTDAATVNRVMASVRGTVAALLGCYYFTMYPDDESWVVELWSPAWTRRVDADILRAKLTRIITLLSAAQLLRPIAALVAAAEAYASMATEEAATLQSLLDTLTAPSTPAPGTVRRPLHPFS